MDQILVISLWFFCHVIFGVDMVANQVFDPCDHLELTRKLHELAANHTQTARLISIGKSVEGREIWVMILSDSVEIRPLLRPQVKLVGNVNGFSAPSCLMLLRLIQELLEGDDDILSRVEVHVIPNMNPDGYARSKNGSCLHPHGRLNANGVNLNRDFPHIFPEFPESPKNFQPETEAMIDYTINNQFVISLSLISGVKVVLIPFDDILEDENTFGAENHEKNHLTPDHQIFKHLAETYVAAARFTPSTWYCSHINTNFPRGITNGAAWSPQKGTMMDFNYVMGGSFELTIGLACCRNNNNPSDIQNLWHEHKEALFSLIKKGEGGVRGQVLDSYTQEALVGAELIIIEGSTLPPVPFFTSPQGEFWRPLIPATNHSLKVRMKGYKETQVTFQVNENAPTDLHIKLEKSEDTWTKRTFEPTTTAKRTDQEEKTSEHLRRIMTMTTPITFTDSSRGDEDFTFHRGLSIIFSHLRSASPILSPAPLIFILLIFLCELIPLLLSETY